MRQSCRPKHQVLVLKCYPKFQKTVVDVKPNQSELSYLLYYASTRRSKLPKVGAFLAKKTESDVRHGRTWEVQLTLRIVKALIDKSPRDLPIWADSVLHILQTILNSNNLTTAGDSVATFESFCQHHDGPALAASQDLNRQFQGVIAKYISFTTSPPTLTHGPNNRPVALRWQTVGLEAISCVASSSALSAEEGNVAAVMPMILRNLYSAEENHLQLIQQREGAEEADNEIKRRMSFATAGPGDIPELQPAEVPSSTADADKLAEERIALLALKSLRQIFLVSSKSQIRAATIALLEFTVEKLSRNADGEQGMKWAVELIRMVAQWAPVQDRYIILVTVMETLVACPMTADHLEEQIILATVADWLLSSDVNLIGLSVMDVLLDLAQHILLVLEMDVPSSELSNSLSQPAKLGVMRATGNGRTELVLRLQTCIGDLATHIYYSDQVIDMVSAILSRLKPSPYNLAGAMGEVTKASPIGDGPSERPGVSLLSEATVALLNAVRNILTVANAKEPKYGAAISGRNRVGPEVWKSTQNLLRDHQLLVRKTYVDILLTWLRLEVNQHDMRALTEEGTSSNSPPQPHLGKGSMRGLHSALTANSTPSARQVSKPAKLTFLSLLHLTIHELVLDRADSEPDIALMYLLLSGLVEGLGVTALRSGLPMVFKLQQDIDSVQDRRAKIAVGSLVYGYFAKLSETFDFEATHTGREIQNEISRRKGQGLWMDAIQVTTTMEGDVPVTAIPASDYALRAFDKRDAMVDLIASGYAASLSSPPCSPTSSPSRRLSVSFPKSPTSIPTLPEAVKNDLLSEWSKEAVIASCQAENSKSASLSGSKRRIASTVGRNYLTVNGAASDGTHSPKNNQKPFQTGGPVSTGGGHGAALKLRHISPHELSATPDTASSRSSVMRVNDLKRVLSGNVRASSLSRGRQSFSRRSSSSSESVASGEMTASNGSYKGVDRHGGIDTTDFAAMPVDAALGTTSNLNHDAHITTTKDAQQQTSNPVPPVPPLPQSFASVPDLTVKSPYITHTAADDMPVRPTTQPAKHAHYDTMPRGRSRAGAGTSVRGSKRRGRSELASSRVDLDALFDRIPSGPRGAVRLEDLFASDGQQPGLNKDGLGRPPY